MSSAAEAAAVTAALDVFSMKRSQSLPETELAAIVTAVTAATDAASSSFGGGAPRSRGSPGRSKSRLGVGHSGGGGGPHGGSGHGEGPGGSLRGHSSLDVSPSSRSHPHPSDELFLHHISEGNSPDETSEGTKETASGGSDSRGPLGGDAADIDLDTASRGDLAAEVRRLQERLAMLEAQSR